jgi:rare lipoprotein A
VNFRFGVTLLAGGFIAACGTLPATTAVPPAPTFKPDTSRTAAPVAASKRGGYYLDDGPGDNAPADLASIPDAVPKNEPLHRFANKPYTVLGRNYAPLPAATSYRSSGIASWYGRKFHGQKTSSGEIYDMYGMTAAHPLLPIPSYVRVTNPANNRSVVVRVNDRGPFHADRLIDLSYTAAWKLGYIGNGSTRVDVELLQPGSATLLAVTTPRDEDALERLVIASTTPPPSEVVPLPSLRDAGGVWLQLGAFGNRDNADAFQIRIARELAGSGLDDKLVIRSDARLHRIQLGPYTDAAAARMAADTLQQLLGTPPVVVKP